MYGLRDKFRNRPTRIKWPPIDMVMSTDEELVFDIIAL